MKYKQTIIAVFILGLVGLAVYQVQRYFGSGRVNPKASMIRELTVETRFKDYDEDELRSSGDTLQSALYQRVYQGLNGLEPNQRPSDVQADLIAKAYARFLVLRRTATREEYLAEAKREPINGLVNEDPKIAELAWKYNSAWARHKEIPVETIRVVPIFIRGVAAGDFAPPGKRTVLKLANGELFSDQTVGNYSVYQVLIDMTVPSVDASEEFNITVGTMLINDRPQGVWRPVAVEFIGLPPRKVVYLPSP